MYPEDEQPATEAVSAAPAPSAQSTPPQSSGPASSRIDELQQQVSALQTALQDVVRRLEELEKRT
jgi:hypothetical protein